jgi:hypothetical protein
MASPNGSTCGNESPVVDSAGNGYVVYPTDTTTMVQTINLEIGSPGEPIDLILFYSGNIYILCSNGAWFQYGGTSVTGGGWTSLESDPRT